MVFHPLAVLMNLWKVLALVMIALLAVAIGLRFAHIGEHEFPIDEKQKIFAINAARDGMKNEIGGADFNVTVQDQGSIVPTASGDKKVVHVILTKGNITLTALVDMDSGSVVQKSMTESNGWMTEYQDQNPKRWCHQRLFKR